MGGGGGGGQGAGERSGRVAEALGGELGPATHLTTSPPDGRTSCISSAGVEGSNL